jgi:hypothetical protein
VKARVRQRRGGLLLEILLALALFLGAGAFVIAATRSAVRGVDRAGREAVALDLARSTMAELETGLTTLSDLRDAADGLDRVGTVTLDDARWLLDVQTEAAPFAGLTLVIITVREGAAPGAADVEDGVSFTLRQLVRLSGADGGGGALP